MENKYSDSKEFKRLDPEQKILDRSSRLRLPAGMIREEALSMLKTRIAEKEKTIIMPGKSGLRLIYIVSSIAATLLIMFGVWKLWIQNPSIKIIAEKGSHLEYRLPEGSDIQMNAESRITFDKSNFKNNRHLTLDGEAFFNVTTGSSFTISANNGEIKVLGTSFNVYSRVNSFKVSCLTGKVLVSARKQSVTIIPGESAAFSGNDLISVKEDNINSTTSWINGEFNYINSPLNSVFNEIERQFNITFAGQDLENKFFTGSFTNKDLKAALDIVCIPMGLKYEIGNSRKIFISEVNQ